MDTRTKIIAKNIAKAPFVLMLRVPYVLVAVPLRVLARGWAWLDLLLSQWLPSLESLPPTPAEIEEDRLAMIQRRREARQRVLAQFKENK